MILAFLAAELEKQVVEIKKSLEEANQALATAVETERKLNAQVSAASNAVSCKIMPL